MKTTILTFIAFAIAVAIFAGGVFWRQLSDPRPAVYRIDCLNRTRQLVIAMHQYHDRYGTLPPAVLYDADGKPMHSWRALILPFLEEQLAFNKYDFEQPWDSPNNLAVAEQLSDSLFSCPSTARSNRREGKVQSGVRYTNYVAVVGPGTAFADTEGTSLNDFPDGTSSTVLVVEYADSDIQLLEPRDISAEDFIAAYERSNKIPDNARATNQCELSRHSDGINLGLADGSVRTMFRDTDPKTVRALTTIAGGEIVIDF